MYFDILLLAIFGWLFISLIFSLGLVAKMQLWEIFASEVLFLYRFFVAKNSWRVSLNSHKQQFFWIHNKICLQKKWQNNPSPSPIFFFKICLLMCLSVYVCVSVFIINWCSVTNDDDNNLIDCWQIWSVCFLANEKTLFFVTSNWCQLSFSKLNWIELSWILFYFFFFFLFSLSLFRLFDAACLLCWWWWWFWWFNILTVSNLIVCLFAWEFIVVEYEAPFTHLEPVIWCQSQSVSFAYLSLSLFLSGSICWLSLTIRGLNCN